MQQRNAYNIFTIPTFVFTMPSYLMSDSFITLRIRSSSYVSGKRNEFGYCIRTFE